MTHAHNNDIEQLRHADVNLRQAARQLCRETPRLRDDFAQCVINRLTAPAPQPRKYPLRRWAAAAVVIVCAGVATSLWMLSRDTATPDIATVMSDKPGTDTTPQTHDMPLARQEASDKPSPTAATAPEHTHKATTATHTDTEPIASADSETADVAHELTDNPTEDTQTSTTAKQSTASPHTAPPRTPSHITLHTPALYRQPSAHTMDIAIHYNGIWGRRQQKNNIVTASSSSNMPPTNATKPEPNTGQDAIGEIDTHDYSTTINVNDSTDEQGHQLTRARRMAPTLTDEGIVRTAHHDLPITVGLSLSLSLSHRLSLETGLSYTRLHSTFDTYTASTVRQETQTIHYLGLPLRLGIKLYTNNRWQFYATAGTMLEMPVASQGVNAPWQWSAVASIGCAFALTEHIGLYVEPSLQWFIPTGTDVETYRTEHPLQPSLPFGIRLSF